MSDNRTTERLMAMLEERGVEYKMHGIIGGKAVTWHGSVCNWVALPDENGLAVAVYKDYLTPEQAIAATLGNECATHGTLTAEQVREAIEEAKAELLESCEYVGDMGQRKSDVLKAFDKMEQAIADELSAELGSGTCEVMKGEGRTAGWWVCQSCGSLFDMVGALACNGKKKPNYCPGCGKKVVG